MLTAIIFSRDRAAQLDLLLKSIDRNAAGMFKKTSVIWRATNEDYVEAYETLSKDHRDVTFVKETKFVRNVRDQVSNAQGSVTFFCDDDIFYRQYDEPNIDYFLERHRDILCVSLRLGSNTTHCYPLRCKQEVPRFEHREGLVVWNWRENEYDFSYPGSLDGHVFRKDQLRVLLLDSEASNPNELEEHLNSRCKASMMMKMAAFPKSLIVGNPINRVNETHRTNRFGDSHYRSEVLLNDRYLSGKRVDLNRLKFDSVNAAHYEFRLEFTR